MEVEKIKKYLSDRKRVLERQKQTNFVKGSLMELEKLENLILKYENESN